VTGAAAVVTLSPRDYDAVFFDLDGVLTKTAQVHAAAWKRLFDRFLEDRARRLGAPFVPFDLESDYRRFVDGKPRLEGAASFLRSRGIEVPAGSPDDPPGLGTIHALSRLKDDYFLEHLQAHRIEPFEASVALARALRDQEIKTAVVSSSNHCAAVLASAGISHLFDLRVDGLDIARLGLPGKPAPDVYLEAARRLGVEPSRGVVVEDAISGVEAGRGGRFACVIGVDRTGCSFDLRKAGAHIVVKSLSEVRVAAEDPSTWSLVFNGFDPPREGTREALCALGNGYFTTRAAAPGAVADDVHYPGTYLAGGYNRLHTEIGGRVVENEDLVNLPNWVSLRFRIEDEDWFDERKVKLLSYRQEFDLRRGLLARSIRFEDAKGRRSALEERRLVSMADRHLGALELSLTAENWSAPVTFRTAVDGRVANAGVKHYRLFNKQHLMPLEAEKIGEESIALLVRTSRSALHVAQAARAQVFVDGRAVAPRRRLLQEPGYVAQELTVEAAQGKTVAFEKIAALYTSRDEAVFEPLLEARKALARAPRFAEVMGAQADYWKHLWRRFDVNFQPAQPRGVNLLMLLRFNTVHLLQAVSFNSIGRDIGVPARGWTGEAYQGHVFWDELFIFPFFNLREPEITRSLLMYRYRRLGEARAAARDAGYRGAMFPWQSGSDGEEVTRKLNFNLRSQRWMPDNTHLERHIGSAVAYNVWQYFQVTQDQEFLEFYGAELILEIARFWSSIATFNEERGRYEIRGVMGPDEFHDAYPGAPGPGLANNAYTNVMAVWVLCRAREALERLTEMRRAELTAQLDLSGEELARWDDISRRMFVPIQKSGIISQFEGYEDLRELDWKGYAKRYGNIQRLELILESENDSANRYKVSKQPDVLMLFYLFSSDELRGLFERLGYPFERELIPRNVAYYDARSTHGSTLSRVVHAWVLARSDRERSLRYFAEALQSDVGDIQQGTTAEGVHLGAMAGAVSLALRATTGPELRSDALRLDPELPPDLQRLDGHVRYRGHSLDLHLTQDTLIIRSRDRGPAPIKFLLRDRLHEIVGGTTEEFRLEGKVWRAVAAAPVRPQRPVRARSKAGRRPAAYGTKPRTRRRGKDSPSRPGP